MQRAAIRTNTPSSWTFLHSPTRALPRYKIQERDCSGVDCEGRECYCDDDAERVSNIGAAVALFVYTLLNLLTFLPAWRCDHHCNFTPTAFENASSELIWVLPGTARKCRIHAIGSFF